MHTCIHICIVDEHIRSKWTDHLCTALPSICLCSSHQLTSITNSTRDHRLHSQSLILFYCNSYASKLHYPGWTGCYLWLHFNNAISSILRRWDMYFKRTLFRYAFSSGLEYKHLLHIPSMKAWKIPNIIFGIEDILKVSPKVSWN